MYVVMRALFLTLMVLLFSFGQIACACAVETNNHGNQTHQAQPPHQHSADPVADADMTKAASHDDARCSDCDCGANSAVFMSAADGVAAMHSSTSGAKLILEMSVAAVAAPLPHIQIAPAQRWSDPPWPDPVRLHDKLLI